MKTVLVTGGAGYVGSHACKTLSEAGFLPVTYDSLENGHRWAVRWGPLEQGCLRDRNRLLDVFRFHRPMAVFHFAAYAYVGESVTDPFRYYNNNIAGTLSLLDTMRVARVRDIVFSSTCTTYGAPQTSSIAEDHPQLPVNPYGYSKLVVERIIDDFARAYGLRYAILRYFNAAGAAPDADIGELHRPETHLIPLAIKAALGQEELRIFGTDYDTPDGTAVRDYVHVNDLANAHFLALAYISENDASIVVNLGTGRGNSVRQIITEVESVTGRKIPVVAAPRRTGDPPRLVANAERAARLLGWRPTYVDIERIIATAYAWEMRLGSERTRLLTATAGGSREHGSVGHR